MSLAYLLDPGNSYQNINGVNNVGGWFEVFLSNTDDHATVYSDFAETLAPERIGIDNNGRAVMIVDDSKVYRVEMHDRNGVTRWTQYPVWPLGAGGGGGGGGTTYIAGDGINISGEVISVSSNVVQDSEYVHTDNNYTDADKSKLDGIQTGAEQNVQSDWTEADSSADSYIQHKPTETQLVAGSNITFTEGTGTLTISASGAPAATGVTQYLSWDGTSNLFSDIAAIVAAGNVPVVRYQGYDWVCTDSTNDNRFVFMSSPGEGSVFGYIQFFSGTSPTVSFKSYVLSDGLSTAMANSKTVPIIMYPPTSSDVNESKKNRAAICRLDKNHSDDGVHTDNYCEFLVTLNTGATANGNANSSVSLHVLAQALEDGGPYNVDMRITANNNWDLENARPTIATADTGTGNDGVIVFFGLFNRSNTAWVDFEQTTMTVVVLNPVPVLLGNTDKVNSLSGLTIHQLSPDNIPSVYYGSAYESLCIDSNGALEWAPRIRGILTEDNGQGGVTSSNIKNLHINTNVGNAALLRVTPVGGSVQIIGYLAPDYATTGDEGKLLRVNSDGTDLEWANPPFIKHDITRYGSSTWLNPYTEEWPIFDGEMTFKMEWTAGGGYLGPSVGTPYLKGKVVTASGWTAYIHVSKGASGNMTYQETSIVHGTSNNTYVDLSQCDYGNGFKVNSDNYPMIVNIDIQYVKSANIYRIGHLTWMKTDNGWTYLHTTYDG